MPHITEDSPEMARAHQWVVGSIGLNGNKDRPRMVHFKQIDHDIERIANTRSKIRNMR